MREYRYQATDATIDVLRRLKSPWQAATLHARSLLVRTEDGTIRLSVEREEVESALEVHRIHADAVTGAADDGLDEPGRDVPVADLAAGRNDVVLFTGETWMEEPADGGAAGDGNGASPTQVIQLSGRPGQRPPSATVVCTTTDAIVVAAGSGEGILIRIGARPMSLETVQDRAAIARFLVLRGYTAE